MAKVSETKVTIKRAEAQKHFLLQPKVTSKNGLITLENRDIICRINSRLGGKIYSLKSKKSGREFLFQDTRTAFDKNNYSFHDISGFDECFPTVSSCQIDFEGQGIYNFPDHGCLWNQIWDFELEDNIARMSCYVNQLKCLFERDCIISDDSIRFEYRITNKAKNAVPFIYSAHPFLQAENNCQIELPGNVKDIFMYVSSKNSGFADSKWLKLDELQKRQSLCGFDCSKEAFFKCFSNKLNIGKAAMFYPSSNEKIEIGFDAIHLPYLGIFISEGYDSLNNGDFRNKLIVGLEPTTGIGDELVTAKSTETLNRLAPSGQFRFWITIRYFHTQV